MAAVLYLSDVLDWNGKEGGKERGLPRRRKKKEEEAAEKAAAGLAPAWLAFLCGLWSSGLDSSTLWGIRSGVVFSKAFLACSILALGLTLHLLCSPTGNRNF